MTIDHKALREAAENATPGPWKWWTSNSRLRLTAKGRQDGGVISAYPRGKESPDILCKIDDQQFIEAANPAVIIALLDELAAMTALANDRLEQMNADRKSALEWRNALKNHNMATMMNMQD